MSHELSDLLRDAEELDTGVIDHCVKLALELEAALEESRRENADLAREVELQKMFVEVKEEALCAQVRLLDKLTGERDAAYAAGLQRAAELLESMCANDDASTNPDDVIDDCARLIRAELKGGGT